MSAPDRSALVASVVNAHRELFGTDDTRRGLLYYICEALNKDDGGEWGVLVKDDRGGFIPSDVIVYRSTMEHFDVLQGAPDGPSWQPHGPITNPRWRWERATTMLFAPGTLLTPAPPAPPAAPTPTPPGAPSITLEDGAALLLPFMEPLERIADGLDGAITGLQALHDRLGELQRDGLRLRLR
jgi:hypothetical protein